MGSALGQGNQIFPKGPLTVQVARSTLAGSRGSGIVFLGTSFGRNWVYPSMSIPNPITVKVAGGILLKE